MNALYDSNGNVLRLSEITRQDLEDYDLMRQINRASRSSLAPGESSENVNSGPVGTNPMNSQSANTLNLVVGANPLSSAARAQTWGSSAGVLPLDIIDSSQPSKRVKLDKTGIKSEILKAAERLKSEKLSAARSQPAENEQSDQNLPSVSYEEFTGEKAESVNLDGSSVYETKLIGELEVSESSFDKVASTISEIHMTKITDGKHELFSWSFSGCTAEKVNLSLTHPVTYLSSSQVMLVIITGKTAIRVIDSKIRKEISSDYLPFFEDLTSPQNIPNALTTSIKTINCNMFYTYAVTKSGQIWTWGVFTERFKEKAGLPLTKRDLSARTSLRDKSLCEPVKSFQKGDKVCLKVDFQKLDSKKQVKPKYYAGTKLFKGCGNNNLQIFRLKNDCMPNETSAMATLVVDFVNESNPDIGYEFDLTIRSDLIAFQPISVQPNGTNRASPVEKPRAAIVADINESLKVVVIKFDDESDIKIFKIDDIIHVEPESSENTENNPKKSQNWLNLLHFQKSPKLYNFSASNKSIRNEKIAACRILVNGDIIAMTQSRKIGVWCRKTCVVPGLLTKFAVNMDIERCDIFPTVVYGGKSISGLVLTDGVGNCRFFTNTDNKFELKKTVSGVRHFCQVGVFHENSESFFCLGMMLPESSGFVNALFSKKLTAKWVAVIFKYLEAYEKMVQAGIHPVSDGLGKYGKQPPYKSLCDSTTDGWKNFLISMIDYVKPDLKQYKKKPNEKADNEFIQGLLMRLTGTDKVNKILEKEAQNHVKNKLLKNIEIFNKHAKHPISFRLNNDKTASKDIGIANNDYFRHLPGNNIIFKQLLVENALGLIDVIDGGEEFLEMMKVEPVPFQYAIGKRDYLSASLLLKKLEKCLRVKHDNEGTKTTKIEDSEVCSNMNIPINSNLDCSMNSTMDSTMDSNIKTKQKVSYQTTESKIISYIYPEINKASESPLACAGNPIYRLLTQDNCTYTWTGSRHCTQGIYECLDCDITNEFCCCTECALTCHRGHRCTLKHVSPNAYCDCSVKGGNCKSLVIGSAYFRESLFEKLVEKCPKLCTVASFKGSHLLLFCIDQVERQRKEQYKYYKEAREGCDEGGSNGYEDPTSVLASIRAERSASYGSISRRVGLRAGQGSTQGSGSRNYNIISRGQRRSGERVINSPRKKYRRVFERKNGSRTIDFCNILFLFYNYIL